MANKALMKMLNVITHQEMQTKVLVRYEICPCKCSLIIYDNSLKLRTVQSLYQYSITVKWIKQIVAYPYNGILPSNRKEQTSDVYNNMSESQNH